MSDIEFSVLEAQQNIHELIAQQHPLEQTLSAIADWVSSMMPGALVSIMRFHPATNSLSLMPSGRFSDHFSRTMQDIPVIENMGTCGSAAFTKRLIVTDNIQKDPSWTGFHDLAEAEGIRACWSMPILTSKNELLGTFATYYRAPATPTTVAQRNLARGAALVALAILRHRDAESHRTLSEWHQALFDNHPDGVYTNDLEGYFQSCNAALERITGYSANSVIGLHFNQFVEPEHRAQTQAAFDKASQKVQRSRHSVNLRHDLHAALLENQFEIYYQPLVDAITGRMRSVEALVGWNHPDRGMVSPGDFIPLAEQTGQIVPLGLWVLKQACLEIADFNAHREKGLSVAVNISSLQFIRDGFLDDVCRVLEETGLPPQLLELEVTESVLLDGAAAPVIELMKTLKTLGVRVALDDFGTGFSSLSYLRDLPTHKVKLDRSFVGKTTTDHRIAAIVQGVITVAHHMDMIVVAEGIETREQQDDLARRHCDILQGFLFARPMPMAELKNYRLSCQ